LAPSKDEGEGEVETPPKPPDWGKIYSRILYHTGMNYEEIARRTIPQIMAILDGAGENIPINMGIPGLGMGTTQNESIPDIDKSKPPKLSQFANFAGMFNT